MKYNAVAVMTLDGEFVGYAIKGDQAQKLQSTNLWFDGEEDKIGEQLGRLNQQIGINAHWPDPRDPDVVKILDDPTFMPIEMTDQEVVDEISSYLVWKKTAEVDEHGNETGRMVDSEELDPDHSVLVYKTVKAPKNPSDLTYRMRAACEQVARQRAGLLS